MLRPHSKQPEGRGWQDQGSRHRSISSQDWLVECPWSQSTFLTGDVSLQFACFCFHSLWNFYLNFCSPGIEESCSLSFDSARIFCQRGRWPQRSQALASASSCWVCFCSVLWRGLQILCCHCITQAIEKKAKLTIPAFMISIYSFKEPLSVSLFVCRR